MKREVHYIHLEKNAHAFKKLLQKNAHGHMKRQVHYIHSNKNSHAF